MELSRLRTYIGDDPDDGPETVLVIKGFSGREEVQLFCDQLIKMGQFIPAPGKTN